MGVYIYAVFKSRQTTVEFEGQPIQAARLGFICRASALDGLAWSKAAKRAKALIQARLTKMEDAWGEHTPTLAIMSGEDGFKEGDIVFAWPKGKVHCDDYDFGGAKMVGKLLRQGRRWRVVSLESH